MKKNHVYTGKTYRRKNYDESKDKWDHKGFETLMKENNKNDYSQQNGYFKKKREDPYSYRKEEPISKPLFKSEPQVIKCYSVKTEGKPETTPPIKSARMEKNTQTDKTDKNETVEPLENNEEKEKELMAFEEKLSNVSTSFSSKEKPLEEDVATPGLQSTRKNEELRNGIPTFQINIMLQNETKSFEISQEEEIEDKLNDLILFPKGHALETLAVRIYLVYQIKKSRVFPETSIERILDKYLEDYERLREKGFEKIEEVNEDL